MFVANDDHYTPPPQRIKDGYSSYHYHMHGRRRSSSRAFDAHDRQDLVRRLISDIYGEEKTLEDLLRAFDVDAKCNHSFDQGERDALSVIIESPEEEEISDGEDRSYVQETSDSSLIVTSTCNQFITPPRKVSYLMSPLRQKYFPNLSPTVLEAILRSPSVRELSSDGSFSGDISMESFVEDYVMQGQSVAAPMQGITGELPGGVLVNVTCMPLTPPPSTLLPTLSSFLPLQDTSSDISSFCSSRSEDEIQFAEFEPPLSPAAFDSSSPTFKIRQVLEHQNKSAPRRSPLAGAHEFCAHDFGVPFDKNLSLKYASVPQSVLRNFAKVIEELKSSGKCPENRRRTLIGSLVPLSVLADTSMVAPSKAQVIDLQVPDDALPSPRASDSELVSSSPGSVPVTISDITPDSVEFDAKHHFRPDMTLNQEFEVYLLNQAVEAEKHAAELRAVAERLERMAAQRKKLARIVIERGIASEPGDDVGARRECFVLDGSSE